MTENVEKFTTVDSLPLSRENVLQAGFNLSWLRQGEIYPGKAVIEGVGEVTILLAVTDVGSLMPIAVVIDEAVLAKTAQGLRNLPVEEGFEVADPEWAEDNWEPMPEDPLAGFMDMLQGQAEVMALDTETGIETPLYGDEHAHDLPETEV